MWWAVLHASLALNHFGGHLRASQHKSAIRSSSPAFGVRTAAPPLMQSRDEMFQRMQRLQKGPAGPRVGGRQPSKKKGAAQAAVSPPPPARVSLLERGAKLPLPAALDTLPCAADAPIGSLQQLASGQPVLLLAATIEGAMTDPVRQTLVALHEELDAAALGVGVVSSSSDAARPTQP